VAIGSTFPADFLQKVEQVLTVAESWVQNEANAKKDQADREYQEKKAALETVAKKWGIPIE
jgi:trehalose utilization protein